MIQLIFIYFKIKVSIMLVETKKNAEHWRYFNSGQIFKISNVGLESVAWKEYYVRGTDWRDLY